MGRNPFYGHQLIRDANNDNGCNANNDNGSTYGGLHPCVITDDFLFNANDLCGTGYLCDTYLVRSTDVNASDDIGCTYGGLHPCVITDDFLFSANNLCGPGYLCDTYLVCV